MRYSNMHAAIILAFYCGILPCFAQQAAQTTATIPKTTPSVALFALENNSEAQQAGLDPKLATEGIVTYRVVVNSDGSILRREKIGGDPYLQSLAEPFVNSWHFKKVGIRGSASSWWSFVGVCFFPHAGKMVPCYLPQNEPGENAPDTLPTRLFLVGNAKGNDYHFLPLRKTKGASLQRPELARVGRITGGVTIDVLIAPDGLVSQATPTNGHPLLLDATIQAVRGWRFAPVTFVGNPVEVQLRFRVQYGPND